MARSFPRPAHSSHTSGPPPEPNRNSIRLLAGLGVDGDAHAGEKIKHLGRVARDPSQPNLRQVHLIHAELPPQPHQPLEPV